MKFYQEYSDFRPDGKWYFPFVHRYRLDVPCQGIDNAPHTMQECYLAFLMGLYKAVKESGENLLDLCQIYELDIEVSQKENESYSVELFFPNNLLETVTEIQVLQKKDLKSCLEDYKIDSIKKYLTVDRNNRFGDNRATAEYSLDYFTELSHLVYSPFPVDRRTHVIDRIFRIMKEWTPQMTTAICDFYYENCGTPPEITKKQIDETVNINVYVDDTDISDDIYEHADEGERTE